MSGVYVYNADSAEAASFYVPVAGQQHSPFVPDNNFFAYTPSPNTMNFPLPPASPFLQTGFIPPPSNVTYQRERRPSWSGAYEAKDSSNYLQPPQAPGMHRRSFSAGSTPQPAPGFGAWPPTAGMGSPAALINPMLTANDFVFDLSLPSPSPKRFNGPGQPHTAVPEANLSLPATHPPLTRLRIVCDRLPDWPIEIKKRSGITVSHVLKAIHEQLHTSIVQPDWDELSSNQQKEINKAYLKRCRNAGTAEEMFKRQGVKQIDFLCDKIWFRGLVFEGPDKMKMFVV